MPIVSSEKIAVRQRCRSVSKGWGLANDIPVKTPNGNPTYYYVVQKDDWKDVPTIGVDTSDTHGDSGGAVFDKTTLRVIGILRGGPDGAFAAGFWFYHDKVIPMSEVMDSVIQADSNLLTTYKVSVSP